MYFKACVQYFGPFTVYQGVLDRISKCIDKIDADKDYVRVVVSMFGRETPVELELGQAELLEE